MMVSGGVSDRGYNSMTHEEAKSISTMIEHAHETENTVDKVKKEVKNALRFTLPKNHRKKENGENGMIYMLVQILLHIY